MSQLRLIGVGDCKGQKISIVKTLFLKRFALAQFADIADERVDHFLIQCVAPAWHTGRSADGQPPQLDRREQLLVGAGFQIIRLGVVTGWHGQQFGVDPVTLAFKSVALGAIPLINFTRFSSNRTIFRGGRRRSCRDIGCPWGRRRRDSLLSIVPTTGQLQNQPAG